DFLIAKPRMAHYLQYSARIYSIYLQFFAQQDIHVYSIDEVFIDVTKYLRLYHLAPVDLARRVVREIYEKTGITATAGIGSNLYLAKVAMDILAKHEEADEYGTRVAQLDEQTYRERLWPHQPITDFWRVGRGVAKRLAAYDMHTMGDVARCSLGGKHVMHNEDLLYKLFGVNAELLIDHAWGFESCTIEDIKQYKPEHNSLSSGQVLTKPYSYDSAILVVKEMADQLSLTLTKKQLLCNSMSLLIGYESLHSGDLNGMDDEKLRNITRDRYGRLTFKPSQARLSWQEYTASSDMLRDIAQRLFERCAHKNLLVRRINISVSVMSQSEASNNWQPDIFTLLQESSQQNMNQSENTANNASPKSGIVKEEHVAQTLLDIKNKFGANSVIKAMNLQEDSTAILRNQQIGGHHA
ncbi:MAG: type VI secretion protein ImpB, partial [Bifidobacteriaceae bacterium]|nr:type VI secretion protein ImpB [Bifidobacteriaceae bacterium]